MKNLILTGFLLLPVFIFSQSAEKLEENKPVTTNGIELGYRINQESTKKSGDNEYSRYVLEFYAINRSDCNKYIPYTTDPSEYSSSENIIANFYVRNANGKRFTSTNAKVTAKPWWVRVKVTEKDSKGKDVTHLRDMQAGYIFRRNDQLKQQITVLVPKGELPNVEAVLQNSSD